MQATEQEVHDATKKIQTLKAQDTISELKAARESIDELTIERNELKQQLTLSKSAEKKMKQQLVDERSSNSSKHSEEVEELKEELKEMEELWKEKLADMERVCDSK